MQHHKVWYGRNDESICTSVWNLCFADSTPAARIRRKSFLTSGWTLSIFSTSTTYIHENPRRISSKHHNLKLLTLHCAECRYAAAQPVRLLVVPADESPWRLTFPKEASWTSDQDALAPEVPYNSINIQFTNHLWICVRSLRVSEIYVLCRLKTTRWVLGSLSSSVRSYGILQTDRPWYL